jgi:hypothetical protein
MLKNKPKQTGKANGRFVMASKNIAKTRLLLLGCHIIKKVPLIHTVEQQI